MMKPIKQLLQRLLDPASSRALPAIVETELAGVKARFEAITNDDFSRIRNFDGEGDYYREILEEVRDGDCYWDVGSFIGLVSVLVASKCPGARVVAVEPDPEFCMRIRKHLDLNGTSNVELLELGLSDRAGKLALNTSGGTGWAPSFFDKGLQHHVEVPVATLDRLCEENPALLPDVLKIDVEGFEAHVIRGGMTVLKSAKLRSIFLELHPVPLRENGERIGELLATIEGCGFRFRSFQGRKNEILAVADRVQG